MILQTKIALEKQPNNLIDYSSNILLIGSCFSQNIGNKLEYFKFQNTQNPFGILFHPLAIEALVTNAVCEKVYTDKDVFFQNEQWHCFDVHSKLSHASKDVLIHNLNTITCSIREQLLNSTHIIITLGTAWIYRFLETNTVVANCHKLPQKHFSKTLLSVQEIYTALQEMVQSIRILNSGASIIFTVSPVRHLKDGFIENTQSKAHLISAIHQFLNQDSLSANQSCFYFPSYEIMMDELRDYRFYNDDMVHPNPLAIQYIWECFRVVWVAKEASETMKTVAIIQKGLQHKPFNEKSEAHQKFLHNLEHKINQLRVAFPQIIF